MKNYNGILVVFGWLLLLSGCTPKCSDSTLTSKAERPPNFIIIFTDDQGYGDLSCFGARHVNTPNIDRLAKEGTKLTSFYVAAAVCTPSRAALMTGCYPKRVNLGTGSIFPVLLAGDSKGLHPDEITIAEVLKKRGYATGIFGKWHLGDQAEFLPTRQGFDEFFGIPYSHDIHPFHPRQEHFQFPSLPLLEGETVIEMDPDADYLTQRITQRTIQFIEKHRDEPFFLYIPHPVPHHPVHVSPKFMETVSDSLQALLTMENGAVNYTVRGSLYPQAISEIDWSVEQIIGTLIRHKLDSNTLVIFTSDNGPDGGYDREGMGSAGPLRGRKGSTFEGGMRVPAVAWWPGKIPGGFETNELLTAMDLLPTFANLSGADIPQDRTIDGKDIWPVLSGQPGAKSPHDRFFYHFINELRAVRSGPWKYHQILPNRPREN
ncbi:MAG: sulfatase, partial [Cyclobacteriaceae bacterium]|nr:sulfatase [Cyclobacteriaceae bacterium]